MRLHSLTRGLIAATATVVGLLSMTTSPASAIVGATDATSLYGTLSIQVDWDGSGAYARVCGGSLRSYRGITVVETTAQCVTLPGQSVALDHTRIRLSVGSRRLDAGQIVASTWVAVAPGWAWATQPAGQPVANVAIIKPAAPIHLPALALSPQVRPGTPVRAVGGGFTDAAGEGPAAEILQQRDVTLRPASQCAGALIGPDEVCVAPAACRGDGGYPVLIYRHHEWVTVGGASRGIPGGVGCAGPSVYTDYSKWQRWVECVIRTGPPPAVTQPASLASTPASSRLHWIGG
jgi:hypothetical protein